MPAKRCVDTNRGRPSTKADNRKRKREPEPAPMRVQKPRGRKGQVHRCKWCGEVGHRTGPNCPKWQPKAKAKKNRKALAIKPPYFHTRPSKTQNGKKHESNLQRLKQFSYVDLPTKPRDAARKLASLHFLPQYSIYKRRCWWCGGRVVKCLGEICGFGQKHDFGVWLRCSSAKCRTRIAPTAFTPMFRTKLESLTYLRLAYCYSLGLRVDQTTHMTGISSKVADTCFTAFKVATAWCEQQVAQNFKVDEGEGEVDGAKFGVTKRQASQSVHRGRVLAVVARESGEKTVFPLNPRKAPRGRSSGAESFEEVDPVCSQVFQDGSLQMSDAAHAFKKSAKVGKRPALSVNHTQGQFSRFAKLPLKDLSKKLQKVASKRKSTSRSSLRTTVSTNMVEGFIGNMKQFQAKRGLLGGGASANAELNTLSGVWLMKNLGIEALGQAMGSFQNAYLDKCSPADLFDKSILCLKETA